MQSLKYLLLIAGTAMFLIAGVILAYDAYLLIAYQRRRSNPDPEAGTLPIAPAIRWRTSAAFVMLAWAPLLISAAIVIFPSGLAGVPVSQTEGGKSHHWAARIPGSQQAAAGVVLRAEN
jgi:hypothetical protein